MVEKYSGTKNCDSGTNPNYKIVKVFILLCYFKILLAHEVSTSAWDHVSEKHNSKFTKIENTAVIHHLAPLLDTLMV